jgi:iron(III) transport system permease protein
MAGGMTASHPPLAPRYMSWPNLNVQATLFAFVFAVVAFFVLYPLVLLIAFSFQAGVPGEAFHFTWAGWHAALDEPGMLESVFNTGRLLIAIQGIALPVSIVIAWLIARTDMPGRNWLEFMFWIAFFLPALSITLGWILCLDPQYGVFNKLALMLPFVHESPFNIYSFWGVVWAHLGTNAIAIKVMLLAPAFRNMDAALEEAARVCGANRFRTLLRIVVPTMTPAILTIVLMVMIRSMQGLEIELVLGPPFDFYVYSTKIYGLISQEPPQFAPASALATIGLMAILPLVLVQRWIISRRQYTTLTGKVQIQPARLGRGRHAAFALICAIVVLLTLIPLGFLFTATFMKLFGFFDIAQPWTFHNWIAVITDDLFIRSLINTLLMSGGAGMLAVILYPLIAYYTVRSAFRGRSVLDFLSWIPFAIPGVLLGVGLLYVFLGNPVLKPLYGTMWVLILATVASHMTLGTQIIKSNMIQLGAELEEAGRVAGATWLGTYRRIVVPIIVPVLLVVGVMVFVTAARDIASVALLATNETRTLALLQLDYMVDGRYEYAAVVSVVVIALSTGVALIVRALGLRLGIRA